MYNKYLPYILLFALTIFFKPVMAQEVSMSDIQNIKVSQLSDEQVIEAWKKLQDSGISEQDAYKLLAQKGMPPTEIEALKDRVSLLGLNKKATVKS
jgi:hypothetical protein